MVILLSACNNFVNAVHPVGAKITIQNNTKVDLYGLELNWYQNDRIIATQGVANANGSKFDNGEEIQFDIMETEVKMGEKVEMETTLVIDQHYSNKIVTINKIPFRLEKGVEHKLEIISDEDGNFIMKLVKEDS